MTAPIRLPLPLDFYNRPPKELAGYSSTSVENGGPVLPPTLSVRFAPDGELDFHAVYGYPVSLPAQPAALIAPAAFVPHWKDAQYFTHARIVAHLATAGTAGSMIIAQYAPDYDAAPSTFADAAALGSAIQLSMNQTGALRSPWVELVEGARADVVWRPVFVGGDGATTPVIGKLSIQFRVGDEEPEGEKWYLRTGPALDPDAPGASIVPLETAGLFAAIAADPFFDVSGPSALFTSYDLPDPSGLSFISQTKGNAGSVNVGGERNLPGDVADYVCSWVGPPLAGGQAIPRSQVPLFYKEGDSLFHSWPVWRVGIWRPGTGVVASWNFAYFTDYIWRRFVPLNAYAYAVPLDGAGLALTVDGDRWIVGMSMIVENTEPPSGLAFGRTRIDGATEPVPGTNLATDSASYLVLPKMTYLTDIA